MRDSILIINSDARKRRHHGILQAICFKHNAGTSHNYIIEWNAPRRMTYRSYFKLTEYGRKTYSFWFSNTVDSTFDEAQCAWSNRYGGEWTILSMKTDTAQTLPEENDSCRLETVTFGGMTQKTVTPDEKFYSDDIVLDIQDGE